MDAMAQTDDVPFYTQHHEALEQVIKQHGIEYFTAKKDNYSTGLSNQGATCYLNSLLQALFHLQAFREALFAWRYDESAHGPARECIALQLQRLFARLALSAAPFTDTQELTTSFGWEGEDAFEQHDVQELCRVLFEALSLSDLPPSPPTTTGAPCTPLPFSTLLPSLFGGSVTSRLSCCVCGYGSTPLSEPWMDVGVQMVAAPPSSPSQTGTEGQGVESAGVVGPCTPWTDLHAALRAQSKSEVLEGADAWACPSCATTRTTPTAQAAAAVAAPRALRCSHLDWPLPPVLTFHLHRFGWDAGAGRYTKVAHPFSFPLALTGTRAFTQAEEGQGQGEGDYRLSAVLLHAGNARKGHYLAFVRVGEGEGGEGRTWLLANDAGLSSHAEEQVAAAVGCTPVGGPSSSSASASGGGGMKLPVGATPYLLLYTRGEAQPCPTAAPPRPPAPPLAGPLQYALYNGDHPSFAPLAAQYAHAQGVLGAGLLPHALQVEVHASNARWAALARAAALRPLMTRLSLHHTHMPHTPSSSSSSPSTTTTLFARHTDTLAQLTARVHRAWCSAVQEQQGQGQEQQAVCSVEAVRLRRWEGGSGGGGSRMGQPLPGPGWAGPGGSSYTPQTTLEAAGLAPSAALCLELHPSAALALGGGGGVGGWVRLDSHGWPLSAEDDVTVRLLPWCTHLQALCAERAARASGRGGGGGDMTMSPSPSPSPIPLRPSVAWDSSPHGEGEGGAQGAASVMLHAALATLPAAGRGTAAALASACAALGLGGVGVGLGGGAQEGGSGGRQWRLILLPGGLPTAEDIQEGRAAARLRSSTGRQGLQVTTLPSPSSPQGGQGGAEGEEELCIGEGDDLVLLPPCEEGEGVGAGAEERALAALSALYSATSLLLNVRLAPALCTALAHPPTAHALRTALAAWVHHHAAAAGDAGGGGSAMQLTWPPASPSSSSAAPGEPPMPLPAPHVLYSCCTATSAATTPTTPLLHVACSKEDSLATLLARALACALGGQLTVPAGAGLGGRAAAAAGEGEQRAPPPPALPMHGRRAARAPMWRVEDEARTLAALDLGQGSGLMLCLGPALPATLAVVRAWSLVGEGERASLVLLGSTLCPLSARLLSVKKALHATLAAQGLLGPSPHEALTPLHLRLRTLGRTGGSSGGPGGGVGERTLLRDEVVLRSAVPALAGGGLAATVQMVVAGRLEELVLGRDTAPASLHSTGDERDVLLQLLPAPESIGREDLVLRVRQLLATPTPLGLTGSGGEAASDLAERQAALLASLHAVGAALGLYKDEASPAPHPLSHDPEAWLPALGLPPPSACCGGGKGGQGLMLGPVEEVVLPRGTSPASLAAALARGVSAGQRAVLQLTAAESGLQSSEEEDVTVPVPVRLARVSAHSPGMTPDVGLLTWHGPLLVGAAGGVRGPGWAQGTLMAAPLGLTDGCTLLWRADPCPCPAYPPAAVPGPEGERPLTSSSSASAPLSAGSASPGSDKENSGSGRSGTLRGSSAGSGARAVVAARRASRPEGDEPEGAPLAVPEKPWLAARRAVGQQRAGLGGQRGDAIVVLAGKPPPAAAAAAALQQASRAAENSHWGTTPATTTTGGGGVKIRMRGRAGES